jgi:monothiol glutaredoxin
MSLDPALRQRLDGLVKSDRVVLFMKGTRAMPRCGFSAAVVEILDGYLDQYETVDVLADPAIREGIKEYSDWPTLPQLYVDGQLVGGADIVRELAGSGELQKTLGADLKPVALPQITVSDAAAAALKDALGGDGADAVRFRVGPRFQYELSLGSKAFGDVELSAGGVAFVLDRKSAERASGTVIDFVKGPEGEGFKIENPNEPAKVRQISATALKDLLDRGDLTLFDVRPAAERAIASIAGAIPLEGDGEAKLQALPKDAAVAFHCHHGMRSQAAAEHFRDLGWKNVFNLAGGIEAWSAQVDAGVPRY